MSRSFAGLCVLSWAASVQAEPPTPSPTANRRSPPPVERATSDLLEALAHLPDDVAVTVVVPNPERFFRKLEAHVQRISASAATFARQAVLDGLAEAIGGPVQPTSFRRLGIAVDREIALILDPHTEVAIVRFGLHDRRRFEAWLSRTVPEDRRSMDLGRERAIVLYPDSELPIICLLRVSHAHCQLGVGRGQRPGAALQKLMAHGMRPLSDSVDVIAVRPQLHEDPDLTAFIRPKLLTPMFDGWAETRSRRSSRFDGASPHHSTGGRSSDGVALVRSSLAQGRLFALSFSFERGAFDTRMHAVLEARAAARLASLVASAPPDVSLSSWTRTPALARMLMRLEPDVAAFFLGALGFQLSSQAVNGSMGILLLGIDSECRAAKSQVKDPRAHLFYLPMAAAVGLRGPVDPRVAIRVDSGEHGFSLFSGVRFEEGASPQSLKAEHFGSPLEVRASEQVLLLGTGEGTLAAAERRWGARNEALPPPGGFFELSVDLAAVRAALAAARIERSSDDLKRLRSLEQQLDLWMNGIRRVELSARTSALAPQLSLEFSGR